MSENMTTRKELLFKYSSFKGRTDWETASSTNMTALKLRATNFKCYMQVSDTKRRIERNLKKKWNFKSVK